MCLSFDHFQRYLEEHDGYHDDIVQRNKEIASVLDQHEQEVILYEAFEEEGENRQEVEKKYIKRDDPDFVSIFLFILPVSFKIILN